MDTNLSPPTPPLLAQHPGSSLSPNPLMCPQSPCPTRGSCRLLSFASSKSGAWTGFSQLLPRLASPLTTAAKCDPTPRDPVNPCGTSSFKPCLVSPGGDLLLF